MAGRHTKKTSKAPLIIIIAVIVVLVATVAVIVVLNINKTSKADSNATSVTTTAITQTEATTVTVTPAQSAQNITDTTTEATSAVNSADATQAEQIVLPTSQTDGSATYFNASYAPFKAVDADAGNECTLKEVFGSSYTKGVLTFNENGTFTDGITNSSANTGAYSVVNQTVRATYSNDKNMTVTVTQWEGGTPAEMIINYGGYDVYFN